MNLSSKFFNWRLRIRQDNRNINNSIDNNISHDDNNYCKDNDINKNNTSFTENCETANCIIDDTLCNQIDNPPDNCIIDDTLCNQIETSHNAKNSSDSETSNESPFNNSDEYSESSVSEEFNDNYEVEDNKDFSNFSKICDEKLFLQSFTSSFTFIEDFNIETEALIYLEKSYLESFNIEQKSGLSRDWDQLKRRCNFSEDNLNYVSKFMEKHFNCDLSSTNIGKKDYKQFFHQLTFDCCPFGHCVYVGTNLNKIRCPNDICKSQRYYNCCYKNCLKKSYDDSCLSHPQSRRSVASVSYRSIKLLISELVQKDSFRKAIEYVNLQENIDSKENETVFSRNMKEMKNQFEIFYENFSSNDGVEKSNIIMINLVISWFYDGVQVFHRKPSIFAPLLMTIKNMPPNLMNELGFGTFLLSLLTYSPGSQVEKFILYDCFIAELLSFEEGVSIIIENPNGCKVLYRVQLRVATHILDMPALMKVLNFESCFNSNYGCPFCNWGKGYWDPLIRKSKYFNTGNCLGMKSFFNYHGNTQKCMPFDWCSNNKTKDDKVKKIVVNTTNIESHDAPPSKRVKKNNEKLFLVKSIKNHTGDNFEDLVFHLYWEGNDRKLYKERWCTNDSLWNNEVVIKYLSETKQLASFYREHVLGLKPEETLNIKKKKKCSDGYHEDQIYIENLDLSYDKSKESKDDAKKREIALITYLKAKTQKGTAPPLFINSDILDIDDLHYNKLSDDINSIYCDFRKCEHFECLSSDELKHRALTAHALNEGKLEKDKIAYRGVKDWWMFFVLGYVKIEDLGFEPFHVLMNISKQIIDLWRGGAKHRQNLPGVKAYCKENNIHRSLWDPNFVKEWEFSTGNQSRVHSFLKCLIIPKGSTDKMKFVDGLMFQRSGNIKGMGKINIMKNLMDLILFSNKSMRPSYKGVFRTFSHILRRLLVKSPDANELLILFFRSAEFRTMFEKYLPVTEMTMNVHALAEVCLNVKKHLSIYDCWACPGERAHYSFKKLVHLGGGIRPELNVWEKHSEIENNNIINNFEYLDSLMKGTQSEFEKIKNPKATMKNLSYDNSRKAFVYDDSSISLKLPYLIIRLCDFEYEIIMKTIFNEILENYSSDGAPDLCSCCDHSSAFRVLYVIFQLILPNQTFFECLSNLLKPINNILKIRELIVLNPAPQLITLKNELRSTVSILKIIDLLKSHYISSIFNSNELETFKLDCNHIESIIIQKHNDVKTLIEKDILCENKILDIDIHTLQALFKWKSKFYISPNLDFGGHSYKGRGFEYSEKKEVSSDNEVNPLNRLDSEWFKRTQYNSWVKLKPLLKIKEHVRPELPVYAHLNYSFGFTSKTNVIDCQYLNNHCIISSVTSYRCSFQSRETIIVTDSRGKNTIQSKYPNQISEESDPFHNSRMPYLNLSQGKIFSKNLPYFVNSKKIYQTPVASIGFHRYRYKKIKSNIIEIDYKAIDVKSSYEEKYKAIKGKVKDVICIADPKCNPTFLVLIDVSPEVTVLPEGEVIKQEIKDMHKIWVNNKVIYDSSSEVEDDNTIKGNKTYYRNPQILKPKKKSDTEKISDDEEVCIDSSSSEVEDDTTIKVLNENHNNRSHRMRKSSNLNSKTDKENDIYHAANNEFLYFGFEWEDSSCAFDSIFTIISYAFIEMSPENKDIFKSSLGRFGCIIEQMSHMFASNQSRQACAQYKGELLSISYKWDHIDNFTNRYLPPVYLNQFKFKLPTKDTIINNNVAMKTFDEFNNGTLNELEFQKYVKSKYNFTYKLGDLLSIFSMISNVSRIYDEPRKCKESSNNVTVFCSRYKRHFFCNNKVCTYFNKPFITKNNKNVDGFNLFTELECATYTHISKSTGESINNSQKGINSVVQDGDTICLHCLSKKFIMQRRQMLTFPIILKIPLLDIPKNYNIDKLIKIKIKDNHIVEYKRMGIIYGNGVHFTSSIFMKDNVDSPYFYDGMRQGGRLQQKINHSYKTDLDLRNMDCVFYLKL